MMKNWKKLLAASLACTAMLGVGGTASAAYELNSDVKNPTPALKQASQIGVLKYENPAMKNAPNKDAIVVMSFGTTYKETREKTIEATLKDIKAAHPNTRVELAFTSHIIVDRIKEKEGKTYPTPEEALTKLKAEGYTRVALTTLDVIPGMEYSYDTAVFHLYKDQFKKMTMGEPLMYWMGQEDQRDDVLDFANVLKQRAAELKVAKDEFVLFMAHGTPHPANAYYPVINTRFHLANMRNAYVYTVEGWPALDQAIHRLKRKGYRKVCLVPIMMVAGDHATNDMAGDDEDSHKSILEKEGFKVRYDLHGLGEIKAIRDMFVARANEAWDALREK